MWKVDVKWTSKSKLVQSQSHLLNTVNQVQDWEMLWREEATESSVGIVQNRLYTLNANKTMSNFSCIVHRHSF